MTTAAMSGFRADQEGIRDRELAEWERLVAELKEGRAPSYLIRQAMISIDRLKTKPLRIVCGAKTRQSTPCRCKAEPGHWRCKFHGGLSTGPKTPEGKQRWLEGIMAGQRRWRASLGLKRASRARDMGSVLTSGASDGR